MHGIRLLAPSLLGVLLVSGACANGGAPEASEPNELAAEEDGAHAGWHGRRGHGPARLIEAALTRVELTDEQRQDVEALLASPEQDREARRAQKERFVEAVRSGDVASIRLAARQMEQRSAEKTEEMVDKLNELHATLTASQRQALVASVRTEMEARRGQRGHWHDRVDGHRGEGRRHGGHGDGFMGRLVKDLDLTDDQRTQLEAARLEAGLTAPARAEREDRRGRRGERLDAMLTAFERDDFDAAQLGIGERLGLGKGRRGERMTKELEVLLPILSEGQRGALADRMARFHAGRHGAGAELPGQPELGGEGAPEGER